MKFSTALLSFSAVFVASVSSVPVRRDVPANLIPSLGFTAGQNPDGTGNCDGAVIGSNGKPIQVPCACPPDQATFNTALNANVAAGFVINNPTVGAPFPTDASEASQEARIETALVTLQNLHGPGVGCPASSTTLVAQQKAVAAGQPASSVPSATVPGASAAPAPSSSSSAAPAPSSSTPAAPPASTSAAPPAATSAASTGTASAAQVAALAPSLGWQAGVNPDGTGNCDGAVNGANGKPILVPCACPPDQSDYISALTANVAVGHAVNNPTVSLSFPTDSSPASQAARVEAALVTIQNLHGVGQGCPASSTTLSAQLAAAQQAE